MFRWKHIFINRLFTSLVLLFNLSLNDVNSVVTRLNVINIEPLTPQIALPNVITSTDWNFILIRLR